MHTDRSLSHIHRPPLTVARVPEACNFQRVFFFREFFLYCCACASGLQLPESMLKPDAMGFKGGCEVGFMSSARSKEVAAIFLNQAQEDKCNNILEIHIGQVDRGARYMHACMHTYIHTAMRACMHTCTHTCIHAYMHAYIHACMHACIHTYMHACMHTCMHTYMHACMHACIHTYMHKYTVP